MAAHNYIYYKYTLTFFRKGVNGLRFIFILVHFNNLLYHGLKKLKDA